MFHFGCCQIFASWIAPRGVHLLLECRARRRD